MRAIAPKLVAVVLLGKKFQRLAETDENRKKRVGSYVGRCDVAGLAEADTIPADYTWGKLGLAESCGKPAGDKIPFCQEGEFQSFDTAGTLHMCSSKTKNDCAAGGGKVGEGEHEAVPEGEASADQSDGTGPVDEGAAAVPEQYVVGDADADEADQGAKFRSVRGGAGDMEKTEMALDRVNDILDKELTMLLNNE